MRLLRERRLGRAPTPGTGGGGPTGFAPTPGIGTGTNARHWHSRPRVSEPAAPSNITPTPGIGTTPNPSGTLTGGPSSSGASQRKGSKRRAGPQPRGHQGGNRGRYRLPTMSRQRQISERAADVPWPSERGSSTVPHAKTALAASAHLAPPRKRAANSGRPTERARRRPAHRRPTSPSTR